MNDRLFFIKNYSLRLKGICVMIIKKYRENIVLIILISKGLFFKRLI